MSIGIVGGGMTGLTLAYLLARRGVETVLFESRGCPGGLLDHIDVEGVAIDSYYHCILGSDTELLTLIEEIGLGADLRFADTKQGFYHRGHLYPMAGGKDFLLFPPLTLTERCRLGITILSALLTSDWRKLDTVGVEDWLVGLGGRGVFEKVWRPLLRSKFDDDFNSTPATYIWSRLRRTTSTRTRAVQKERMAYLVGGCGSLVGRLVQSIVAAGSSVRVNSRVERLVVENARVAAVEVGGETIPLEAVIVTTPLPALYEMLPPAQRGPWEAAEKSSYLGIVCALLLLDRSLMPYYVLNLTDRAVPFTAIVETTRLIAPENVGGHHLVYLPKYVASDSPYLRKPGEELRDEYLSHLKRMFPGFREEWVSHFFVHRERFVEPLHLIGRPRPVLPVETGLQGLFVVNSGQIYPQLTNCEATIQHAISALPMLTGRLAGSGPRAIAAVA